MYARWIMRAQEKLANQSVRVRLYQKRRKMNRTFIILLEP